MVGRVSGRRNWSDAEKLEILADAFRPGVRVRDVLRRRDLSSGLVYTWRKQARLGLLAGTLPALPAFAEVQMARVESTAPAAQPSAPALGLIRIDLPGGVRVSVDAAVDAGALARVLSVLG
ncbi:IS66-like element accessory protein TnpA [Sphingomonas solaris]|uniref:Transposase n=1 Tax=Alterirhizorhabdus solaris TaxID=2529389 RepID=A0A558QRE2_9SPHN|nr:transposase [Sphingomonas solaris]TVV69684.1 transposase [Sphingomonas solaris]